MYDNKMSVVASAPFLPRKKIKMASRSLASKRTQPHETLIAPSTLPNIVHHERHRTQPNESTVVRPYPKLRIRTQHGSSEEARKQSAYELEQPQADETPVLS